MKNKKNQNLRLSSEDFMRVCKILLGKGLVLKKRQKSSIFRRETYRLASINEKRGD